MVLNNPDGIAPDKLLQPWNVPANILLVFVELDVSMALNKSDGMDVMPVP